MQIMKHKKEGIDANFKTRATHQQKSKTGLPVSHK